MLLKFVCFMLMCVCVCVCVCLHMCVLFVFVCAEVCLCVHAFDETRLSLSFALEIGFCDFGLL